MKPPLPMGSSSVAGAFGLVFAGADFLALIGNLTSNLI